MLRIQNNLSDKTFAQILELLFSTKLKHFPSTSMFNDYILQFDIILHGSLRNKKIPGNKFLSKTYRKICLHTLLWTYLLPQQSLSTISNIDRQFLFQKSCQKFSVNENKKNWWFQKNSLFWHFNTRFVLKTTKTPEIF